MAKRKRQARRSVTIAPAKRPLAAYRPVAWSAVVGTAFAVMIGAPAYADPTTTPDTGTRPAPSGELRLPGAPPSTAVPAPIPGPLGQQIMTAELEVATLGERRNSLDEDLAAKRVNRALTEGVWRTAADELRRLRDAVDSAAAEAYKDAAVLEPFPAIGPDLRGLGRLLPRSEEPEITPWDLARAEQDERADFQAYRDAVLAEEGVAAQYTDVDRTFRQREAALLQLRQDNAVEVAQIEAAAEADSRRLAENLPRPGASADGFRAHDKALAAVRFALGERGKPYEWGAEGPNRYDCSGLMWASYRSVGATLQRVSKDQYRSTKRVTRDMLLPGDLVFFGPDPSDWTSIHHVGMYLGDNLMVHAPRTGDVVKVSTVWWARFFGAGRVFDAVRETPVTTPPATTPTTPPVSPTPPPTTTPPATITPTPPPATLTPTTPPPTTPPPTTPPPTTPPPTTSPPSTPPEEPSSAPSGPASPSPA